MPYYTVGLFLLMKALACVYGNLAPFSSTLRAVAESETRLTCRLTDPGTQVVQVDWFKENAKGTQELIITAHYTEGTVMGHLATRMRFVSESPLQDSSLLISNTEQSDEGNYICHLTTFPAGVFKRQIKLIVLTKPISSVEPVIMMEGQTYGVAAHCRSVGHPPPTLSWDTDLPGQSQNRTLDSRTVSTQFFLHPFRSMNGRRLDCLVSHPVLETPQRISNTLVVHFPPSAEIKGYDSNWFIGLEGAELRCDVGGNPKADITWTRESGSLPQNVTVRGEKLIFGRPLLLTDAGVYQCEARNYVGAEKAKVDAQVAEKQKSKRDNIDSFHMIIVIGAVAMAIIIIMVVVIVVVTHHHRRKNRKLKKVLSETMEQINNISRQTSMRRLNSFSTDLRAQSEERMLSRADSVMKNSYLSLGECVEMDSLGRPAIYKLSRSERGSSKRRELERDCVEPRQKVEAYLKSSNMSLDSGLHSSLVPNAGSDTAVLGLKDQRARQSRELQGVTEGELEPWRTREETGEEEEEEADGWSLTEPAEGKDVDRVSDTCQISEAMANHFYYSNGCLRPKSHSNAMLLNPVT
ncbi:nectin-4 [Denticeps clupeoides]|uniref:Ig-like domain-containing protein n=1 Tax=Denticeps clupeoides TaxID=299321 RepID=A0AAY4BNT3_9TELE|nr:nectin-4-like [Denticeps clupeoides]